MLEEANKANKAKKKALMATPHKRKRKKNMPSSFDPRRMLSAHNVKAAHQDNQSNRVNEAEEVSLDTKLRKRIIKPNRYGRDLVDKHQPVKKEETTMDIRDTISEGIINMLEQNYIGMKENFETVINAKVIERLDEMKKDIASTYFASEEE